jgi:hypothetical protein
MILQKLRIPQTESLRVWLLGEEAVEVAATGEAIPSPSFFLRNLVFFVSVIFKVT